MNHATTTVAVVGGGSLIGTHLVELLHAERPGWRLRVVDNFSTGREQELVELFSPDDALIRLDIRDREGCEEALTGCRIVFHLAAILSMSFERDARTGVEVNVLGMGNVLEATARAGARLVLASSSGGVHGIAPAGVVDESSPFHHAALPPGTAMYGAAKLLAEHRCRALGDQDGLEWVTLRYSSVYGPRQHDRGRHTQALTENLRRL
ncbi:MAG TPA: NAD-dependent epimerase/dehydratase family protein, partial [Solirubrobacteraceae bacterium]|nr:NAD-dependent epimerase/dehydratase family protein [Solirubrobacteraceae bacterium]